MEERLYRGKDKYTGEWIYGYYSPCCFGFFPCGPAIIDKKEMERGCWRPDEVIPETVGQFAGFPDKNGKEMYEGDIVSGAIHLFERPRNGVVTFKDGSFGLTWYRGETEEFNPFTSMCNIEYEVIGNIHDNPELLN